MIGAMRRRPHMAIKRVAYQYDSEREAAGLPGYWFGCSVYNGAEQTVCVNQSFMTRDELYAAMEGVIPLLDDEQHEEVIQAPRQGVHLEKYA